MPLADLVTESVRRTGLETDISVTGHLVAETDPRRLDRIVTNLLLNAHRHGSAPVEVTVDGTTIVVRVTERGHGLTIALGQAHVIGAHLTLTDANTTPGGAIATLELPHQTPPTPT
ncbi:ATP-binding protein [Streptomyces scopuliridis]|uniref:ATP-binding protein n=1 Tax=Streptomyces scopuliridis TaxID=452529 RepID=UPI00367B6006